MKAYILGCSHAAGSEMYKEPGLVFDNIVSAEEYGYTRSYPAKIAHALGYDVENHAIPGGSNDAMYRIFCSLPIQPKDIVIACWTGFDRTEVYYEKENRWLQISHGEPNTHVQAPNNIIKQGLNQAPHIVEADEFCSYAKMWTVYEVNNYRGQLNKSKNIEALNARAALQGTIVINFNSFAHIDSQAHGLWPVNDMFTSWCTEKNFPHTDWGHYFESAHEAFAQYCLKFIDRQKI